jgi:hypothetical protein
MEIRSMGAGLLHTNEETDGRTDRQIQTCEANSRFKQILRTRLKLQFIRDSDHPQLLLARPPVNGRHGIMTVYYHIKCLTALRG